MRATSVSISGLLHREEKRFDWKKTGRQGSTFSSAPWYPMHAISLFMMPFTGQYHARSQPKDQSSAVGGRNVRQHVIITPNLGLAFDFWIRSHLIITSSTI